MGTVTSIGGYDPRRWERAYTTSTTTAASLTYTNGTRQSIALDSWQSAIGAALVAARTYLNVRVNKVGADWVVSWDALIAINPSPTYPTYPQPWTWPYVTYTCGSGEVS